MILPRGCCINSYLCDDDFPYFPATIRERLPECIYKSTGGQARRQGMSSTDSEKM